MLHNIDEPHIWHGNTLTGAETYGGLFADAPALFDVILMNPPFGGKEGKDLIEPKGREVAEAIAELRKMIA